MLSSLSFLLAAVLSGQDTTCTYDRCALRIQYRASGVRLVQGANAVSLAKIGFYPPRINLLALADDSTRVHYEAFREHHTRSATFGLVSFATLAAATALQYGWDTDAAQGTAIGLLVASFGFSLGASSQGRKSRDELSRTIWFYNRRFADR